ncbi:hypothetical protein [Streptomyces sp. NPDC003480]
MAQPPEEVQAPQEGPGAWPDLTRVGSAKEFREALGQLRKSRDLTVRDVEKASIRGDGRKLAVATMHRILTTDALPSREFVAWYLRACGLSDDKELQPWLALWKELYNSERNPHAPQDDVPAKNDRAGALAGLTRRWSRLAGDRRRLRAVVAACIVVALAAGAGAWQLQRQWEQDRQFQQHVHDQERFREQHCGTLNPSLIMSAGECTGVTDGRDGSAVFGRDLTPVMTAIGAENSNVLRGGSYVTVAFLTPLTSKSPESLTLGQYVDELEGAYTAIEEQNKQDSWPKIRLVVGNMGSSEAQWAQAVHQLIQMKQNDHLVAVTGLGLSQQETADAARALSKADLPMVGDLITADGFDATGAVDGRGRIEGLTRVALTNTDQLTAISKELGPGKHTAALVSAGLTANGTLDFYTQSLARGFRSVEGLKKHLDEESDFSFDPRGGPDAVMPTISQSLCTANKTVDTVYYAGRVKYMQQFLNALARRSCHTQHITVVTGSDAAALDPKTEGLHIERSPITLLYASFPSPAQLRSSANPDNELYEAFVKSFTAPHHGVQFPAGALTDSYWPLVAHDAVLTVATALHNAAANKGGATAGLPNQYAVRNELYALRNNAVAGATGHFGIDKNGDRTNTATVTTVHRLGQPLDSTTQHQN